MRLLHLVVGLAMFVIFLLTGQYMKFYYPNMTEVNDGLRLLLRTRHIFILLAGLINISIGVYFSHRKLLWRKILQSAGSALILVASCLLIIAFFYDTKLEHLETPFTHYGMYLLLAGTFFHLFSGLGRDREASLT